VLPLSKEHIRAPLQPYIIEPLWEQFRALLPERKANHPLDCRGRSSRPSRHTPGPSSLLVEGVGLAYKGHQGVFQAELCG
jgi:hypothetical protein